MKGKLELRLQKAALMLSRAENTKNLFDYADAYKAIHKAVTAIYADAVDIPAVLRVEQIMNDCHANVLGKSNEAHKTNEMLAIQAETGFELHKKFTRQTREYVEWADATRKNVQRGRPTADGVPYCPVRSALTEFRDQLVDDVAAPRTGSLIPEQDMTSRARIEATIKAERDFIGEFIEHRALDKELRDLQKTSALKDFDTRIRRQLHKTLPEKDLPQR